MQLNTNILFVKTKTSYIAHYSNELWILVISCQLPHALCEIYFSTSQPEIVVDGPAEDKEDSDKEEDSPLREAAEDLAAVAVLKEVIDQEEEEAVEEAVEELKEEIQERIEEELEDKVRVFSAKVATMIYIAYTSKI